MLEMRKAPPKARAVREEAVTAPLYLPLRTDAQLLQFQQQLMLLQQQHARRGSWGVCLWQERL